MYTIGLDLHQRQSTICILDSAGKLVKQQQIRGGAKELVKQLRSVSPPFQICYEASCGYGYVYEQLQQVAQRIVVAHPGAVRLIFRAKRKHDRVDARKLATLLFLDQVPPVHVPPVDVRSWRRLIQFRRRLVAQRTAVKNRLRALLRAHGVAAPRRASLWSRAGRVWLAEVEFPTRTTALERDLGLDELEHLDARLRTVERWLESMAREHPRVRLLQTIPGVGKRTAEALVAWIDDVRRFRSNRQVGCYFGLVPCQDQSGQTNRLGHITREGPSVVRQLLCEAAWQGKGRSPLLRAVYEHVQRGDPERNKIALVALARHLACVSAAMLRSGEVWREAEVVTEPTPSVA